MHYWPIKARAGKEVSIVKHIRLILEFSREKENIKGFDVPQVVGRANAERQKKRIHFSCKIHQRLWIATSSVFPKQEIFKRRKIWADLDSGTIGTL